MKVGLAVTPTECMMDLQMKPVKLDTYIIASGYFTFSWVEKRNAFKRHNRGRAEFLPLPLLRATRVAEHLSDE